MIVETFTTKGIGAPFREREVSFDFRRLPPGTVVAFVGPNGAGKSHLMELMCPGLLYRELPSYRSPTAKKGEDLADHVHPQTRDAFVEETFRLGTITYRVRVQVDGKRGKTEAYVWRDGFAIAGPHVREVDQKLATIIPPRDMMLAGPFACQHGYDGFFRLGPAARKDLFARMLGVEHLQEMSEIASQLEKSGVEALALAREDIPAVEVRAARAAEILGLMEMTLAEIVTKTGAQGVARERLTETQTALSAAVDAFGRADVAAKRAAAARERLGQLGQVLAEAPAIEKAAADLPGIDQAIAELRAQEGEVADRLRPADAEVVRLDGEVVVLRQRYGEAHRQHKEAVAAAERVKAGERTEEEAARARTRLQEIETVVAEAESRTEGLQAEAQAEVEQVSRRALLESRERDLKPRTTLLGQVDIVHPMCAACPLTGDARKAGSALEDVEAELALLPRITEQKAGNALRAHNEGLRKLGMERSELTRVLRAAEPALATLARDRDQAAKEPELREALARAEADGAEKRRALDVAKAAREAILSEQSTLAMMRKAEEERRRELAVLAGRLSEVVTARAQRQELEQEARDAPALVLEAERTASRVTGARAAVTMAEQALGEADEVLASLAQDHARLEGEHTGLGTPEQELATLRERETFLVTDTSDWGVLKKALGRQGVQALLIEAAGPEVGAIANELIASTIGPRFQIKLTTTKPSADGKKVLEVFEPVILDAEVGREGTQGSGGEMALIDAALRLALVIVNTRRSDIPIHTIWLDEASSYVDQTNAPLFVDMVRAAMRLGGFRHAFIAAHQPAVCQAADVRILVPKVGPVRFEDETTEVAA